MMRNKEYYQNFAEREINESFIPISPWDRVTPDTSRFLETKFCIDVHTHFFDMECINSSYMVMRSIKDIFRIRGMRGAEESDVIEQAYRKVDVYTDDWNDKLYEVLNADRQKRGGKLGLLFHILRMNTMQKVYNYYIKDASLARYFDYDEKQVLTTVLMMDFYMAWGATKIKKSMSDQIREMKELAQNNPVLPFLFCDPRRADLADYNENLYSIFNTAFASDQPFFGVKIYPCLGYCPSDYRLWPIYKICERLEIPVLTHCGGATVSTAEREIWIYENDEPILIEGKNRKEVGHQLNDPSRWERVLKKFPKLKLNIAHFGSSRTWESYGPIDNDDARYQRKEVIIELMKKYDNVYADFSYTITDKKASENFVSMLKAKDLLQKRSMFGSDYWVVHQEGELRDHQEKFLNLVGDEHLKQALTLDNPMQYLFGDKP